MEGRDARMRFLSRIRNLGEPATPEDADRLLVRQLEGMGADLARPRHVVHLLYFSGESGARAAADAVERGGYQAALQAPDETTPQWSLRAEDNRVISPTNVAAFRSWFERIAAEHDGEYDGWEAARKP